MKCMSCGTEMNSTTGGNYTCPKCGQGVNDGVYRPSTNNIYGEPYLGWGQMGWICLLWFKLVSEIIIANIRFK